MAGRLLVMGVGMTRRIRLMVAWAAIANWEPEEGLAPEAMAVMRRVGGQVLASLGLD